MRLCIISSFPPNISGIGQYGWHISSGLAATQRFNSITVLADQGRLAASAPPHPVLKVCQIWDRDDLRASFHLLQALAHHRPEVVWFNAGMTMFGQSRVANFLGLLTPLWTRRLGVPVVTTLHEIVETARLRNLGLQNGRVTHWGAQTATHSILQSNAVCVTLRHYAQLLQIHYGARRVHYFPHGAFTPIEALPRSATAPPCDLLFFASIAPHRGLAILIEAFQQVRQALPAATLTIAGGEHPRYPGYAEHLRASLTDHTGLQWMGLQTEAELRQRFSEARLIVLPYLATSGSSSVINRAAALGRPIIASDLPETRLSAEDVNLQVNYVPAGQAPPLAQKIIDLLTHPEQGEAQAQHNLHSMQTLTLERTAEHYGELLAQVAQHG